MSWFPWIRIVYFLDKGLQFVFVRGTGNKKLLGEQDIETLAFSSNSRKSSLRSEAAGRLSFSSPPPGAIRRWINFERVRSRAWLRSFPWIKFREPHFLFSVSCLFFIFRQHLIHRSPLPVRWRCERHVLYVFYSQISLICATCQVQHFSHQSFRNCVRVSEIDRIPSSPPWPWKQIALLSAKELIKLRRGIFWRKSVNIRQNPGSS